jgi:hypothetical protein
MVGTRVSSNFDARANYVQFKDVLALLDVLPHLDLLQPSGLQGDLVSRAAPISLPSLHY